MYGTIDYEAPEYLNGNRITFFFKYINILQKILQIIEYNE